MFLILHNLSYLKDSCIVYTGHLGTFSKQYRRFNLIWVFFDTYLQLWTWIEYIYMHTHTYIYMYVYTHIYTYICSWKTKKKVRGSNGIRWIVVFCYTVLPCSGWGKIILPFLRLQTFVHLLEIWVFQPSEIFYHLLKTTVTEWKEIITLKFLRILWHFL